MILVETSVQESDQGRGTAVENPGNKPESLDSDLRGRIGSFDQSKDGGIRYAQSTILRFAQSVPNRGSIYSSDSGIEARKRSVGHITPGVGVVK